MDMRDVQFFQLLAKTGSLNRTSQLMYSNVTTCMRRLDALELEFGAKLVTRTNHGVRTTPAGEAFLHTCVPVLDSYENMKNQVGLASRDDRPYLRVAVTPNIQSTSLRRMWKHLKRICPRYVLQIQRYGSTDTDHLRLISELGIRYDLLLCYEGARSFPNKFRFRPLFSEELVLGVPEGHPLDSCDVVLPEDLAESWILAPSPRDNYIIADFEAAMAKQLPQFGIIPLQPACFDLLNAAVDCCLPALVPRSWAGVHPNLRPVRMDLKSIGLFPQIPFGYRFLQTGSCPEFLTKNRNVPQAA